MKRDDKNHLAFFGVNFRYGVALALRRATSTHCETDIEDARQYDLSNIYSELLVEIIQ